MKLRTTTNFQIKSNINAIIIYYVIIIILIACAVIINFYVDSDVSTYQINDNSGFGGMAFSSMIFLLVMGICTFSTEFRMFTQNGISRHNVWRTLIYSSLIISAIMSAIDLVLILITSLFIHTNAFILILSKSYINNMILQVINTYITQLIFNLLMFTIGHFIRLAYYRMNKPLKISVSIIVPAFFFIVLPILSEVYNLEPMFAGMFKFFETIMNPDKFYGLPMMYVFFGSLFILFALINKTLITRAEIR